MLYRATVPADRPKSPGLGAGRAWEHKKKPDVQAIDKVRAGAQKTIKEEQTESKEPSRQRVAFN